MDSVCSVRTFPKVRCVIETSSNLMLNSPARCKRSSRILEETYAHALAEHEDGNGERTHNFSLGNQLSSIELRHDTLQHLISDGGKHTLVVVKSEALVDFGEVFGVRT